MTAQPPNPELAALPDLFLLDPKNRAYVDGKAPPQLETGRWSWIVFFGGLCGLFITAYAISSGSEVLITLFISVPLWMIALYYVWRMRHGQELVRDGRLLMGEVVDYQVKEEYDDELGEHFYYAELNFSVRVSDRRLIKDTTTKEIPDYKLDFVTPPAGTPLAVLYAHEKLYEVL